MWPPLTIAALLFLSPHVACAADSRSRAYATLQGIVGKKSIPPLERRGLIVTAENPDRLIAVSWNALERAEEAAPRLAEFLAAYDSIKDGRDPADPGDAFSDLLALPKGGFLSGPMHDALSAVARRAAAVRSLGERRGPLAKAGSLFRTPWGRELARRTHADLGGSAADAAAPDFFRHALLAPDAPAAAMTHLMAWAAASGGVELHSELAGALSSGKLSAPLEAVLARYLRDQALLEEAESASERLGRVERGLDAKALFKDARTAVPALSGAAGLSAGIKEAAESVPPPSSVRLSAHEVHVQTNGGSPLEPGDKAVFSAAYWLDGLPQKASAKVAEVLILEDPSLGLSIVSRTSRSRSNGGPYAVSVEAELPRSGNLSYRLLLDAEGAAPLELASQVEVSDSQDLLLSAAAQAHWLGQSCRFEDAEKAWEDVREKAGASAKKVPARAAADARDALRSLKDWKARKKELDESLDGARLFASRERCEYRTDRAERALKLLASLPAGCDQAGVGAELAALASVTDSRRILQEAFRAGAARAADRAASCKSTEAAALYASSLALLDSDPDARCGEFEREHAAIRLTGLPRAAAVKKLADSVETELANARRLLAGGNPRAALGALQPLSTALRGLPDQRCWASLLSKADELTEASGVALAPLGGSGLALGPDAVGPALAEARQDWDERQAALREERGAVDSVQAPRAAGGEQ